MSRSKTTRMVSSTPVEPSRDPTSTWERFVTIGGLEVQGRDVDFVDLVRLKLDPAAQDISTAISACHDSETLVRAVFEVVAPYGEMSKDIIEFMRRAGAISGKASIRIAIQESVLGLEQFEEFVKTIRKGLGTIDVADATVCDAIDLGNVLSRIKTESPPPDGVDDWLAAFKRGDFHELPASLAPSRFRNEVADIAHIADTALKALRSIASTREEVRHLLPKRPTWSGDNRVTDPAAVAFAEHDLLNMLIPGLSNAARSPSDPAVTEAARLILKKIPRRPVMISGNFADLERILALPAWGKRFDLYAVWIATRIAAAVDPDRVVLHTVEGALPFAFRPTKLMTIRSAEGPKTVWAERQQSCESPIGKGRTGSVQPDYGLWSGVYENDTCELVVEVKHYKTPALKTFGAALVDYAKAHPDAYVVLVNNGRAAGVVDNDRWSHRAGIDRCSEIGELNPSNRVACKAFTDMIREAAGPEPHPDVLLVDASGSMFDQSGTLRIRSVLQSWLKGDETSHIKRVIAGDDSMLWELSRSEALERLGCPFDGPRGGDPIGVAREILKHNKKMWIVTDASGRDALKKADIGRVEYIRHMTGIELVEIAV